MQTKTIERCPRCHALLARDHAVERPDGTLLTVCDGCIAVVPLPREE